jgi:putative ABC transport system permease protein
MRTRQLAIRNLTFFWRTNLAVVLGVAAAVAVLAGALLVGDSVRGSLKDLFLQRLGNTDQIVMANGFFRDALAGDIRNNRQFAASGLSQIVPLIAIKGTVSNAASRQVASNVQVYGVDERFWQFHGRMGHSLGNRETLVSSSLATELHAQTGDSVLVRIEKPSDIPIESLHSKKEDLGRTLRLNVKEFLAADALGEFSVQPQQGPARAVFVPLQLLQTELEQPGKANLLLVHASDSGGNANSDPTAALWRIVRDVTTLDDFGIKVRPLNHQKNVSIEHDSKIINDTLATASGKAASDVSMTAAPVFSYLANSIASGERSIPYSLVTALDEKLWLELAHDPKIDSAGPPILLNEWAARDLGVKPGDEISLEYYYWHESGRLETRSAKFSLAGIVPISGLAADKDLVPEYPGITGSEHLSDWDPPFPVDLKRIRKQDENYWDEYRTTPKAFIQLARGQELWQTRFGKMTSIRLVSSFSANDTAESYKRKLRESVNAAEMGFSVIPVRRQGIEASRGATDFGEYFLYFSFFLVVSALMLTALFFKLGVEQRLREIGLLQAVGFPAAQVRRLFVFEGLVLAIIGSLIGLAAALGYGQLMMTGLNTWWKDAVGTNMLRLHVSPVSLLSGAVGGIIAAVVCIFWTLRRLKRQSTRSLLMGALASDGGRARQGRQLFTSLRAGHVLFIVGLAVLAAAAFRFIGQAGGFFGGGVMLLAALLCYESAWLRRDRTAAIHGSGVWPVSQLGFRNSTSRPGRSVLCIALIASAAFIIVSVDAFRRTGLTATADKKSGTGGYAVLADSLLPVVHDLNTSAGRESLNLADPSVSVLNGVNVSRFRVRAGDDASCLNLYQPRNPRIIAPLDEFIRSGRFAFQKSVDGSSEEKANPWLLLNRDFADGAVPVIADANSLSYVLHLGVGEDFVLNQPSGPVKLRVVAALADSIFQSELIMAEKNFVRLFPEEEGYRFFLIDTPAPEQSAAVMTALEERLSDFGFDAASTGKRLASFHRVENTYLSTFQMLGGLGLLLGTVGLGAVLLRNVFERRRELALLRAVGYNSSHFTIMVVAENALLLVSGLVIGTFCALLAIAPVFLERGGRLPNISLGILLVAVLISGLTASLIATWAALKSPLLPALKAE